MGYPGPHQTTSRLEKDKSHEYIASPGIKLVSRFKIRLTLSTPRNLFMIRPIVESISFISKPFYPAGVHLLCIGSEFAIKMFNPFSVGSFIKYFLKFEFQKIPNKIMISSETMFIFLNIILGWKPDQVHSLRGRVRNIIFHIRVGCASPGKI